MMAYHNHVYALVIVIVTVTGTFSTTPHKYDTFHEEKALRGITRAMNNYSTQFRAAIANRNGKNFVASPFSADIILSMLAFGTDGNTRKQLFDVLNLPQPYQAAIHGISVLLQRLQQTKDVEIHLFNKIYVTKGLKINSPYLSLTRTYFNSEIERVDFFDRTKTANLINQFCKSQTHDKIDNIVKPADFGSDTSLVALNALYFKGTWVKKFQDLPGSMTFTLINANEKKVPGMFRTEKFQNGYISKIDSDVLILPYEGKRTRMVIIKPRRSEKLFELEQKLKYINIIEDLRKLKESWAMVVMPKFKIESEHNLQATLQEMGIRDIFTAAADFSKFSHGRHIQVNKAIQKVILEVTPEGTRAAAATSIQGSNRALGPPLFSINQPFLAIVQHEDIDLFSARVLDPTG